jgi:hypothetical protein
MKRFFGLIGFIACVVLIVLFATHQYEPSRWFVCAMLVSIGLYNLNAFLENE